MKKAELKQLIKPLVKECIHEVLLEEGLLSNVVSEVAKGLQQNVIVESAPAPYQTETALPSANTSDSIKKLTEHRKKLMGAIDADAYNGVNLFEGTEPAPAQGATQGSVDLGDSRDSGVDISSLMGGASKIWEAMK